MVRLDCLILVDVITWHLWALYISFNSIGADKGAMGWYLSPVLLKLMCKSPRLPAVSGCVSLPLTVAADPLRW
jgi:hypothetical protein